MVRRDFTLACCVQEQLKLGLEAWLSDEAIEYVRTQLLVTDRLIADR